MADELQVHDRNRVAEVLEKVVIHGDLSHLSPAERVEYYNAVCRSLGLNPLTRPFDYIKLQGRLTLYARRDAAEQLRRNHRISVEIVRREFQKDLGLYIVEAKATTPDGRTDTSLGVVSVEGLKGQDMANAIMKAETKAKRRVTLSIVGLGWLDETEVADVPSAQPLSAREQEASLPRPDGRDGLANGNGHDAPWKHEPRPWSAETAMAALRHQAHVNMKRGRGMDANGLWGVTVALLDRMGDRHAFLRAVFGVGSSKELDAFQRRALVDWVKPTKDASGQWIIDPEVANFVMAEFREIVDYQNRLEQEGLLYVTDEAMASQK